MLFVFKSKAELTQAARIICDTYATCVAGTGEYATAEETLETEMGRPVPKSLKLSEAQSILASALTFNSMPAMMAHIERQPLVVPHYYLSGRVYNAIMARLGKASQSRVFDPNSASGVLDEFYVPHTQVLKEKFAPQETRDERYHLALTRTVTPSSLEHGIRQVLSTLKFPPSMFYGGVKQASMAHVNQSLKCVFEVEATQREMFHEIQWWHGVMGVDTIMAGHSFTEWWHAPLVEEIIGVDRFGHQFPIFILGDRLSLNEADMPLETQASIVKGIKALRKEVARHDWNGAIFLSKEEIERIRDASGMFGDDKLY